MPNVERERQMCQKLWVYRELLKSSFRAILRYSQHSKEHEYIRQRETEAKLQTRASRMSCHPTNSLFLIVASEQCRDKFYKTCRTAAEFNVEHTFKLVFPS